MTIHTFGDSHCSKSISGWKDCREISSHWLGPVLCYSFGMETLQRCDISQYVKSGDTVIFCFGEIDCRCHVYKHITQEKSYQNIIDGIIDKYFDAIKLNIKKCNRYNINIKICVYNVVPPSRKNTVPNNSQYPFLGTDEERKSYVLYFNKKLKEKCSESGFVFFDVYDKYADKDGFLNMDLSDKSVHIYDGKFLQKFIDENHL